MEIKYYDIGLNLFCRQFPEPEKVIQEAESDGVCCILTGTDREEDFQMMEKILLENEKMIAVGECGLDYDRMFSRKENQIR